MIFTFYIFSMLTSAFNYSLPQNLIAQTPSESRDCSRLMVVNRNRKSVEHRIFHDILEYLGEGDLLVWNNSKVFKARLCGKVLLDETVAGLKDVESTDVILNAPEVEIFLIRPMENNRVWKVLAKPGRKLRAGMKVVFAEDFQARIIAREQDGIFLVEFDEDDMVVRAKANRYGEVPLPPYIIKAECETLPYEGRKIPNPKLQIPNKSQITNYKLQNIIVEQYQTVYAKHEGSVAAPTAGFHFTPELIEKLEKKGVEFAEVTLHVGLGTFQPVKTEKIEDHTMHSEWVELTAKNADLINQAKEEGRRVIAVGTTTVRVLEGVGGFLKSYSGDINLFITPGFDFKIVDALITNFHLPKSTLLMLVSAFMGNTEFTLECYQKAIEEKYRFYSFGDAMFVI
ncbi:MAG: S-adenosylmethionine:tRNA ribosyltransferase-isomerase [Candidatus Magasanikbacteria bacterium GW2011_GWA2_46_17]|uniref:S-adenosylmethionine:tRNA ribosyltransferase-isomerase n=1 Tax=Candidatus Magasanikbacteria bacterium GW2011_GWA2_46_17 TaxID=1619042 RepID=A0A0G1P3X4_9BACT|nr:MAG: S-adenosylmethionine:tRNA ribosyltransferase-isomerase [Candidatus Magasanikbacteria bacterium GW2011_GWA2_46_17]